MMVIIMIGFLLSLLRASKAQYCFVDFRVDGRFIGDYDHRASATYNNTFKDYNFDVETYMRIDYDYANFAVLMHYDLARRRRLQGSSSINELEVNAHELVLDGAAKFPESGDVVLMSGDLNKVAAFEEVPGDARRTEVCDTKVWYLFLVDMTTLKLLKDTYYASPDCATYPSDITAPWYKLHSYNDEQTEMNINRTEISCYDSRYAPTYPPTYAPTYAPIPA